MTTLKRVIRANLLQIVSFLVLAWLLWPTLRWMVIPVILASVLAWLVVAVVVVAVILSFSTKGQRKQ